MKKFFVLSLTVLLLSGCGVTLNSVVQKDLTKTYKNTLVILPFEKHRTETFTDNLKRNLEETFTSNNQKIEVLLIEADDRDALKLNANDGNETLINNAVSRDKKDLVIFFKPVSLEYYNGYQLQAASYQLIGIDIETKKEVWKANFTSRGGSLGPSLFAKTSAQKIFQQIKADKILD
ncbi:MAG: hypothetical protein Q8928_04455 [Bacteroidota bacterium]|nr:hypothetical protein [Bacteroidota bacterium]